jgi:hypothetical protein
LIPIRVPPTVPILLLAPVILRIRAEADESLRGEPRPDGQDAEPDRGLLVPTSHPSPGKS